MCGRPLFGKNFFDAVWRLVECVHVSGLVYAALNAAGPDGLRRLGPDQGCALGSAVNHTGCPDLRLDRLPSRSFSPCQFDNRSDSDAGYAAFATDRR